MKNYNIKVLQREAVKSIKEGEIKKAECILEKVLLLNDNNTTALNLLALCKYIYCNFDIAYKLWTLSYEKDNNIKAKYFLEKYNKVDEVEIRELYRICLLKVKNGENREARKGLLKVISQNSMLIPPKIILATLDLETKNINNISEILVTYKIDESNIQNKNLYLTKLEEINSKFRQRQLYLVIYSIISIIIMFICILIYK